MLLIIKLLILLATIISPVESGTKQTDAELIGRTAKVNQKGFGELKLKQGGSNSEHTYLITTNNKKEVMLYILWLKVLSMWLITSLIELPELKTSAELIGSPAGASQNGYGESMKFLRNYKTSESAKIKKTIFL